ncbi:MAG: S9 family peptidase, partial [Steroidobacteraceae bacterium]
MPYETAPLVDHEVQRVSWLDDRRFWTVDHDTGGDHYRVMTAATSKAAPLFDQQKLAGALGAVIGKTVDAAKLSITAARIKGAGRYEIIRDGKRYLCDLTGAAGHCIDEASRAGAGKEPGIPSPDGKREAFVRDWNLWEREVATGKE